MKKFGRIMYFSLAIIFFICTVGQIFIAGLAVFGHPANWLKHVTFVHLFGFNVPLFMLLFAFIGKMPKWAYASVFGMFIIVFAMYYTANMNALVSWIGPLHPVIAFLLLAISYYNITKTGKLLFHANEVKK